MTVEFTNDLPNVASITPEAAAIVHRLYRKHVGAGAIDLLKLRDVLRREIRSGEAGIIQVSADLLRELRTERNYVMHVIRDQAG